MWNDSIGWPRETLERTGLYVRLAPGGAGLFTVAISSQPSAVDIREMREVRQGAWGAGSVHHLAWRVDDEEHQMLVYFKEPGGVLFELATDGPGFATDEDPAHLGETLVLPPWLVPSRERIETVLPRLERPRATVRRS